MLKDLDYTAAKEFCSIQLRRAEKGFGHAVVALFAVTVGTGLYLEQTHPSYRRRVREMDKVTNVSSVDSCNSIGEYIAGLYHNLKPK